MSPRRRPEPPSRRARRALVWAVSMWGMATLSALAFLGTEAAQRAVIEVIGLLLPTVVLASVGATSADIWTHTRERRAPDSGDEETEK